MGSCFRIISLLSQKNSSSVEQSLVYIICSLTPCTLRGNIPLSVHILQAPHCIENRYVPLLELVAYSQHSFTPLYHSIHFSMKKHKIRVGKECYLILATIVSPLNRAQNFESTCHPKFGFSMTLRE